MSSAEAKLCVSVLLCAGEVSGCKGWVAAAAGPCVVPPGQGGPDLSIQKHCSVTGCPDTPSEHPLPVHSHQAWYCQSSEADVRCKGKPQTKLVSPSLKGQHKVFHYKGLFLGASLFVKCINLMLIYIYIYIHLCMCVCV